MRDDTMNQDPMHVRRAGVEDAPYIARHRARMFHEMGRLAEDAVAGFTDAAHPYLEELLANGTYHGWLTTRSDGSIIGGAGVQLRPLLPRPEALLGPEAIVLNVYVEPAFRRRGVARTLLEALLAWCREQAIQRIVLHATAAGKPLYESLGFVVIEEMIYRPDGDC
jgi:GNAT superfamily N-acetyltransferase